MEDFKKDLKRAYQMEKAKEKENFLNETKGNFFSVEGYTGSSSVSGARVYGLKNSILASGYPKSVDIENRSVGLKDLKRAFALGTSNLGEGHDNFLNGIVVQFDLIFSNKAWVELQRYHFIDFISSQSTMHKVTNFNIEEQCNGFVWVGTIDLLENAVRRYNSLKDEKERERLYLEILYNLPSGFRLTAAMTTNYRQLKTIYNQRKNHRLPEWREFCEWIEKLPLFEELCLKREKGER